MDPGAARAKAEKNIQLPAYLPGSKAASSGPILVPASTGRR
jgi:hypothetical protein